MLYGSIKPMCEALSAVARSKNNGKMTPMEAEEICKSFAFAQDLLHDEVFGLNENIYIYIYTVHLSALTQAYSEYSITLSFLNVLCWRSQRWQVCNSA